MSDGHASAADAAPSSEGAPQPEDLDAAIDEALARGDARTALVWVVERHAVIIGRVCMALLGSAADADDVARETLLAAAQNFGNYGGEVSLRAWLCGIARAKCLQHLERSRRRAAKPGAASEDGAPASGDALPEARHARARALLTQVRPSDRDALLLRYGADLGLEEVAAACGIDEATARQRISRALLELRSALGERT